MTEINQSIANVGSRLSLIESKLEATERFTLALNEEVKDTKKGLAKIESKTGKLQHAFKLIEEDVAHLGEDFDEVQTAVKNSEHLAKRNNIQLQGFKEQTEGDDLCQYLPDRYLQIVLGPREMWRFI